MQIRGALQAELSYQIGGALTGPSQKWDDIQPLHRKEWPGLHMVLRIAVHKVSSRLQGGLEHFADGNGIPENQPTIFHPSLIVTTPQTSLLFILRTALSAMPFISDRWSVEVRWYHDQSSQDLPNSNELSVSITFGFSDDSINFRNLLFVSWEVFVLHG